MTDPDETILTYVDSNADRINELRSLHWPDPSRPGQGRHPRTWFGPSLPQVAQETDRRVGSNYERFYFENYDRLCWGTHGSTLMIARRHAPTALPSVAALALAGSQTLMMDLTQRVLDALGRDGAAIGDRLAARQLQASVQRQIDAFLRIADVASTQT